MAAAAINRCAGSAVPSHPCASHAVFAQAVTLKRGVDGAGSHWAVMGPEGRPCTRGTPIKHGQTIRLLHAQTDKWLHSHAEYNSPLSNNQEVSGYGQGEEETNSADNWRVEVAGGGVWMREKKVRLKHEDTSQYLHSTAQHQFGQPIAGQREVCAHPAKSQKNEWRAMEGLYVKTRAGKSSK